MIRHPVAGPVICGASTAFTTLTTYTFVYILLDDWCAAVRWAIIADVVLVIYLIGCSVSSWRKERHGE